jgi:alkylation response protein AidB-like acyl-CoA dehydrogenase
VLAFDVSGDAIREPLPNFADAPLADIDVTGAAVDVVGSGPEALRLFDVALWERRALMAAALAGLAQQAIDITLAYVGERRVYGRTVAEFQAVQHRLVDVAVSTQGARLLAFEAAWALHYDAPRAEELAHMALAFAAEAAFRTCKECLQFHGGYGYTLEYDIQLYFRRAKGWPLLISTPGAEWQRIAEVAYAGTLDWPTPEGAVDGVR